MSYSKWSNGMKSFVAYAVEQTLNETTIELGDETMTLREFWEKLETGEIHISPNGYWTKERFSEDEFDIRYRCSVCKKYTLYAERFCPHCGAFNNCKVVEADD